MMQQPEGRSLLKAALESKKTTSRRAVSRQASSTSSSRAVSAQNSKVNSPTASRQPSDDENDDLISEFSTTDSLDGLPDAGESGSPNTPDDMFDLIERICDRVRSSQKSRKEDLAVYTNILRSYYCPYQIEEHSSDLLETFVKCVRQENSETEALNALKAIQITIMTDASQAPYDICADPLKTAISSTISRNIKEEALYTLGIAAFFGGTAESELEELITTYLFEIIDTDGAHVSADDDPDVVSAALDVLALLASRVEDLSQLPHEIMEAIVGQLDSTDVRVQVAAGEAIALLYEKSYTDIEDGEKPDIDITITDPDGHDATVPNPKMKKRYEPYRGKPQLLETLTALSKVSAKTMSKADRKTLHTEFVDIAQSVVNPTLGPRYSTAIEQDTNRHYGSRLKVKLGKRQKTFDKWWMYIRLKAITRAVQGGFKEHAQENEAVYGSLGNELWEGA